MFRIFSDWKYNPFLFSGILLVCFLVSVGARYKQFETWEKTPASFFVGKRPMMTTLDAPFWLRWAREYNEGTLGQKENLRRYPDETKKFHEMYLPQKFTDQPRPYISPSGKEGINYRSVPLLSFIISMLTPFFDYNYYLSGTLLVPLLASLFILPLGVYFYQIGFPLSGLLGGLIGTFSGAYYMRTSIGRIDTDMLNLFFPMLLALLMLMASRAKSEKSVLLYSIGMGLSVFFFNWWWGKNAFSIAYFILLIIYLFVKKVKFTTILLSSFLLLLCLKPNIFLGGVGSLTSQMSRYLVIEENLLIDEIANSNVISKDTSIATFPNTMTTISEVDKVPFELVLRRILSNTIFGWIGLFGFFGMMVLRWRELLPLLPVLLLGLMSFISSNRFIMFLAPFIGIGLGWVFHLVIEGISTIAFKNFKQKGIDEKITLEKSGNRNESRRSFANNHISTKFPEINWLRWVNQLAHYLVAGVFFWAISAQTAINFVPGPSIHPLIYATFLEVKKRVSKHSALLTWWDYGYAITDATGLATFHDGGSQFHPKTYFIAKSLISSDSEELYDITQYLATESNRGIAENNKSPEALLKAVRNPAEKPWNPIYLFFTADMTGKYGAISKLGSWNISKGGSQPSFYKNLSCNKITNEQLNCRGANINLKSGVINNQIALRRLVFIRDGRVLREQEFGHTKGFTIQLIVAGKNIVEVQMIDESVFSSNYNQMFLLGRYRKDLFEEAYNAFPFSRLYRVKY